MPVTDVIAPMQYATGKGSILVVAAGNDGNPVPATPANMATMVDKNGNLVFGGKVVVVGSNSILFFSQNSLIISLKRDSAIGAPRRVIILKDTRTRWRLK